MGSLTNLLKNLFIDVILLPRPKQDFTPLSHPEIELSSWTYTQVNFKSFAQYVIKTSYTR